MFWNSNSSQFEALLQKEGITLQELMDQEDVIQECKSQNAKLVEFLCQRNILEELVTLITEEPSEELDERVRFKYPNIACELLTCDVPSLNESLSSDNQLLEKLYSFMEKDPPLNPLLASFLSRTLSVLIVRRLDHNWISHQVTCLQAMGFLKDKENFIGLLLKHLGTSAIMDLTLKFITEVGDAENRQNVLNWLDSQNLVQSLIGLFDPKVDSERHYNVSQLLCDVLRISRDSFNDHRDKTESDPVLNRLESPETVALLLDQILGADKSESSIVGGIQVLLALLGHKNGFNEVNSVYTIKMDEIDTERKQKVAESTALVISRRLKDFQEILLDPPKRPAVKTSIGCLDPPLGNTRLQIVKLIVALISVNNSDLLQEMINLGIIEVLLDLFFKYVWNNFLHAQVEQCIKAAFKTYCKLEGNEENAMYSYLIVKCRLLGRILEAWDDNDQKQTKPKGIRQGYMGHLINIANLVVQEYERDSVLNTFIKENVSKDTLQAWENFVKGALRETNRKQQMILGGVHPRNLQSYSSTEDYNSQPEMFQQQVYSEFQQMTPDAIAAYSINEGLQINENDNLPLDRCANINLNVSNGEMNHQAELFKKVCSEYINTLDDTEDNIFDDADDNIFDKHISGSHPSKQAGDDNWDPRGSSSDEEDTEKKFESDPWFSLESNKSKMSINDSHNPWSNADASNIDTSLDSGWADFGSFATEFPMQATSTEKAQETSMESGDKNSNTDLVIDKKHINSEKKVAEDDKNEGGELEEDEMFECASETIPVDAEDDSALNMNSSSQPCTNVKLSSTDRLDVSSVDSV